MTTEGQPEEIEPDPRESAFVLPPLDGRPFADAQDKARAVLRVIEQAERERASPLLTGSTRRRASRSRNARRSPSTEPATSVRSVSSCCSARSKKSRNALTFGSGRVGR